MSEQAPIKATAHLEIFRSRSPLRRPRWYWRLRLGSDIVAGSLEGYSNKLMAREMGVIVCTGGYEVVVDDDVPQARASVRRRRRRGVTS